MRNSASTSWIIFFACFAAAACSKFHAQESQGGETHFLQACEESSECGELSCVCGVCTQSCESDDACEALDEAARCVTSANVCEGAAAPMDNVCALPASEPSDAAVSDGGAGCSDPDCGANFEPLVLFVTDTSGSMERIGGCVCETPECAECLPDCSAQDPIKSRWTLALEALTGTFQDFNCVERVREAPFATYDLGYYLPHFEPAGAQRDDGMLDVYAQSLRFGSVTFDGWDTYLGAEPLITVADFDVAQSNAEAGLWSYPSAASGEWLERADGTWIGAVHYPNSTDTYRIDTGIRGANATHGRLIVAHDPSDAERIAAEIQADLSRVRPYGGTPTAAAFDDLYWYFTQDPAAAVERDNPRRRRHVVLITDNIPDDDYRSFGCDCAETDGDCGPSPPNDPADMKCPYPTAEQAALRLRCGYADACDEGVVDAVHVIGLGLEDENVVNRLNEIAAMGGTQFARFADPDGTPALRTILDDLLRSIAE